MHLLYTRDQTSQWRLSSKQKPSTLICQTLVFIFLNANFVNHVKSCQNNSGYESILNRENNKNYKAPSTQTFFQMFYVKRDFENWYIFWFNVKNIENKNKVFYIFLEVTKDQYSQIFFYLLELKWHFEPKKNLLN